MKLNTLFRRVIRNFNLLNSSYGTSIDNNTARVFIKFNIAVHNDSTAVFNLFNNSSLIYRTENLNGYRICVIGYVNCENILIACAGNFLCGLNYIAPYADFTRVVLNLIDRNEFTSNHFAVKRTHRLLDNLRL